MTKLWIGLAVVVVGSMANCFSQENPRALSERWEKQRQEEQTTAALNHRLRGSVVLADDTVPASAVEINVTCAAFSRLMAIADTKGHFSFSFQNNRQTDTDLTADGCVLSAYLPGYRSELKRMADYAGDGSSKLGTITLTPIAGNSDGLHTGTADQATAQQRKAYEKAVDKASRQDYDGAIELLQDVVAQNKTYSNAWLALGIVQQAAGKLSDADQSYLRAAEADHRYAAPYIRAASLEIAARNLTAALAHSLHAIEINPSAFPDAYLVNAQANTALKHPEAAERSASAGIALDPTHRYPDLQYLLAMALYNNGKHDAAIQHLQTYLRESPHAPSAPEAAKQLAELRESNNAIADSAHETHTQALGPQTTNADLPTVDSVQNVNATLLANLSDYICLASIATLLPNPYTGGTMISTPSRLEIGVSQGREIYGEPGGKRLSENDAHRALAASAFHTSGIFSSLARLLMQSRQLVIEPAGALALNGRTFYRYNVHSPPSFTGWNIAYGNQSGAAAVEGWFLVDAERRLLRRVFVSASNIPANLKLLDLRAIVDYEPETIGERRVLVPSQARIDADEQTGAHRTNLLSFNHWRSFNVEAKISFDGSTGSESAASDPLTALPAYTVVAVTLSSAVPSAKADDNHLRAALAQDVKFRGKIIAPRGTAVEGRVHHGWNIRTLVVEFDRLETAAGSIPFYALLMQVKPSGVRIVQPETRFMRPPSDADPLAALLDLNVPGVATLLLPDDQTKVAAGTTLFWRTASVNP